MKSTGKAWLLFISLLATTVMAQTMNELKFCLRSEPKTFNPLLVDDDASDTIRYLTGGVLLRVNRQTQALEPGLATSWKVSKDDRTITFVLREHVYFSDGTPFGPEDVSETVQRMMDPSLHSPIGDSFRSGEGEIRVTVPHKDEVAITFPAPVAGLDRLFDEVAIISAHSPNKEKAAAGPYYVADYKSGAYVLLKRNPNYWKRDFTGRQLPYIDSIQLDIQSNRDIEALRFKRGEIHLINSIDTEYYDRLASSMPGALHDAGPSLDSEQMWFNQVSRAPLPAYKQAWFHSRTFRLAVSQAINREDITRVVFGNHARPAVGPVSPANKLWFNTKLRPEGYDPAAALKKLQQEGFRLENGTLVDHDGHGVEFSLITNSGNKYRENMAAMIQQDLAKIGMRVNVVTLDFPSLLERMTEKFDYEAVLLGLVNVEPDPNSQMNVWLSSGDDHQWNPRQASPETPWEAEINRLMRAQASAANLKQRKAYWDKVQEIVVDQAPFIYLVNRNALSAISPMVHGATPVALRPQTFWNIEYWSLQAASANGGTYGGR
jgi:peptide/nickel transport system substrate-binding protein